MPRAVHIDRLKALGLNITQAAEWLEVPPKRLLKALSDDEPPYWAQYCLDGMEAEHADDPESFASCQLGADLSGDTWSARTARAAIPILVARAPSGQALSYRDLDETLRRNDPTRPDAGRLTKYARPLGMIGALIDAIRKEARDETSSVSVDYANLPPIECLVVNGRTGVPGAGIDWFLRNYLADLGEPDPEQALLANRKAIVARIHRNIAAWKRWDILKRMGQR